MTLIVGKKKTNEKTNLIKILIKHKLETKTMINMLVLYIWGWWSGLTWHSWSFLHVVEGLKVQFSAI